MKRKDYKETIKRLKNTIRTSKFQNKEVNKIITNFKSKKRHENQLFEMELLTPNGVNHILMMGKDLSTTVSKLNNYFKNKLELKKDLVEENQGVRKLLYILLFIHFHTDDESQPLSKPLIYTPDKWIENFKILENFYELIKNTNFASTFKEYCIKEAVENTNTYTLKTNLLRLFELPDETVKQIRKEPRPLERLKDVPHNSKIIWVKSIDSLIDYFAFAYSKGLLSENYNQERLLNHFAFDNLKSNNTLEMTPFNWTGTIPQMAVFWNNLTNFKLIKLPKGTGKWQACVSQFINSKDSINTQFSNTTLKNKNSDCYKDLESAHLYSPNSETIEVELYNKALEISKRK